MKKYIKWYLLLVVVCNIENAFAQYDSIQKLSLKECVAIAIKNNQQIQQAVLNASAAQVDARQAKHNALPDLFANLGHGINEGRSIDPFTNAYINRSLLFGNYSLSSSVLLYNGSQNKNLIRQNNLLYQANKLEAQQTKENITLSILLAYLQVLNNEDLLEQSRNQAEVTRQQVDRLQILDRSGAVAPQQLYDLKGQLANDELAIINNQNALNESKLTLTQLMNVPYDINLGVEKISTELFPPSVSQAPQAIYQQALQQLPMIKAAELRTESARKGIAIAKGSFFPAVRLGASINTNYSNAAQRNVLVNTVEVPSSDFVVYNGNKLPVITQQNTVINENIGYGNQFRNNYNTAVFLNVNVPILNGFRARNRVAIATIDSKAAALQMVATKNQLNQQVEQAHYQLIAANKRLQTLERQVADFNESFRTAEVRFKAGVITQVEYLVAKNNADNAKINWILARYDFLFRSKIVDYYLGKLVL